MRPLFTQQVLGLDFGTSSVKAVLLRTGLMGVEWAGGHQMDLPRSPSAFDWAKESMTGIKEWIAQHRLPTDRVVVSVPAHLTSIRSLALPFSDARQLEKIIPFEIEALLPYPLEEVVVDYHVTGAADGKTQLLTAAVPRELLKHYLGHLAGAGIDPEAVELDGLALMNLARYARPEKTKTGNRPNGDAETMALDIGASKTVVCIMRRGQAVFLRTILWGGRNLTTALQEQCGVSPEEAEEWKRQAGLMDEGISRLHQKEVSQTIRRALEPFMEELARTIRVYRADAPLKGQKTAMEFILCGGGGKLKGLESHLASELGLQPAGLSPRIASGNGLRWDPVFAQGLGLALKATRLPGGSRMNFRKGEFVYAREATAASSRARYLGIAALVVAALAATDLYANYGVKMSRYQTLKAEVREQFRAMFPEVKNIVDEIQQAKTAVAELKKKSAMFGAGEWTSLQLVAELTRRMPPSVKIEVQDLAIEPGRVRLEAETDTFDSVDKIKAALGQFEGFRDATVSDAKVSADQSRVRFRLTVTVVPRGEI